MFGVREHALRRLPGGAGHAWTDGRLVLKPVGCVSEHAWVCGVYAAWDSDVVRVPEPVAPRGADGDDWSAEGWGAHVFVRGRDVDLVRELRLVKEASDAFHHSVKDLPRPDFMDAREDPWAYGDRLAWEEAEPDGDDDALAVIRRLTAHLAPVTTPEQVIHGDILPNVLAADGWPPAVIDWPPYFRPLGTANAVAVTDAVTFRGGIPVDARRVGDGQGLEPTAGARPPIPTRPHRTLRFPEPTDGQPDHARRTCATRGGQGLVAGMTGPSNIGVAGR